MNSRTIMSGQLFAGHAVGPQPVKSRKRKMKNLCLFVDFCQSWGVSLQPISLMRARPSNKNFNGNSLPSIIRSLGISLLFSKIWRPLCSPFVQNGCLIFFKFTMARAGSEMLGTKMDRKCMNYNCA